MTEPILEVKSLRPEHFETDIFQKRSSPRLSPTKSMPSLSAGQPSPLRRRITSPVIVEKVDEDRPLSVWEMSPKPIKTDHSIKTDRLKTPEPAVNGRAYFGSVPMSPISPSLKRPRLPRMPMISIKDRRPPSPVYVKGHIPTPEQLFSKKIVSIKPPLPKGHLIAQKEELEALSP
ncbi:hypothetical protein GEMRC1_011428 [Eukaryota sp. GEM-RC1]